MTDADLVSPHLRANPDPHHMGVMVPEVVYDLPRTPLQALREGDGLMRAVAALIALVVILDVLVML